MCLTPEEAEAFHAALREPTGEPLQAYGVEPYHDGTDPYSRYEETEEERAERIRNRADEARPSVALTPGQAETLTRRRPRRISLFRRTEKLREAQAEIADA